MCNLFIVFVVIYILNFGKKSNKLLSFTENNKKKFTDDNV